jgi:metallophosphoesterase superfamily enzyme
MISIINDIHLGARRQAGTTNHSREQLGRYTFEQFKEVLKRCSGSASTIILGDLFNKAKVGEVALYMAFRILCDHMRSSNQELILVRGNHDNRSETVNDMCSLELLYVLLKDAKDSGVFEGDVYLIYNEPEHFDTGGVDFYIIPHVFNQEEFDRQLGAVPEGVGFLLLHCNYDNYFAQGDHSLNLSKSQAKKITDTGTKILIAHEHHARRINSNLIILGNQFPTSIDDCLGGGQKAMYVVRPDGTIEPSVTWEAAGNYLDSPYDQVEHVPSNGYSFVRVSGVCEKSEFARVVREVNELRKRSNAFIVSNAVKMREQKMDSRTKEEIETIDIVGMLLSSLSDTSRRRVEACLND